MPFLDKTDFRFGFWLGLGLITATLIASIIQYLIYRARTARNG